MVGPSIICSAGYFASWSIMDWRLCSKKVRYNVSVSIFLSMYIYFSLYIFTICIKKKLISIPDINFKMIFINGLSFSLSYSHFIKKLYIFLFYYKSFIPLSSFFYLFIYLFIYPNISLFFRFLKTTLVPYTLIWNMIGDFQMRSPSIC